MSTTSTVILGGGFGGISAANTLRRLLPPEHAITVVDQSARFYVGAGKTWIMLGERTFEQISQARRLLLDRGIELAEAEVRGIDLVSRTVATSGGSLAWDHLVIALGADVNLGKVPGLAEAAQTFYTVAGAEKLRDALARFDGGDVVLLIPRAPFKCPPAPYEAAMLLHAAFESRGIRERVNLSIHTVEGAPMATAGPEMGQFIKEELARRGIGFHPQRMTTRVDGTARRVVFEDGNSVAYDLLIAIPPHEAPQVVRDAGLTNAAGWIAVDPQTLHVQMEAGGGELREGAVWAVGDVTTLPLPGRFKPEMALALPKAGVFAEAQGRVVAHQIAAKVLGGVSEVSFDGEGFCYLETGGGRAVKAEGAFFSLPHPVMAKRTPDEAQMQDKLGWVAEQLRPVD
jgi:sulfide:quinone oxidoreductase